MKSIPSSLFLLLFLSLNVAAHGPTPQKAVASVLIDASLDDTWSLLKDFDGIAGWHPDIQTSEGDGKNQSGSQRTLTLNNGGQLLESMDYYSDTDHEYNYRLDKENVDAFPVSFYSSSIQVSREDGKTLVKWKNRFYRGDTSNFPSEKLNDDAAVEAMNAFINNGLNGLKEKLEK